MTAPATRLLLAGLGARGAFWREVIRRESRAEAVAYVDPSRAARDRVNDEEPGVPVHASLAEAIDATQPDALILATPPDGRERDLAVAWSHELPVLVEKPLALDLAEAAGHVRDAEAAGVSLMVGLNFRYLPVTREAKRLLGDGPLGVPEFARFTYERWRDGRLPRLNKYPLTMEQPMLWEQSIHHFDLLRFLYDREPIAISAKTFNPSWSMYRGDANVTAWIELEGGLVVDYHGTWQSNHAVPSFEWRTEAARGVAFQRHQFGELTWALRDASDVTTVPLPPHETWITDAVGLLDAFLRHLRDGAPLECSGADHVRSLAMVEACIRSSTDGSVTDVPRLVTSLGVPMS